MPAKKNAQAAHAYSFYEVPTNKENDEEGLYFEDFALEFFNKEEAVFDENKGKILQFKRKLDQHNQRIVHHYHQKFDKDHAKNLRMAQLLGVHILRQFGFKDVEDEVYNIASTFVEEQIEKGLEDLKHELSGWNNGLQWKFHVLSVNEDSPFYLHRNQVFHENEAILLVHPHNEKRGNQFIGFLPGALINSLFEETPGLTERIEISRELFLKIPPEDWPLI